MQKCEINDDKCLGFNKENKTCHSIENCPYKVERINKREGLQDIFDFIQKIFYKLEVDDKMWAIDSLVEALEEIKKEMQDIIHNVGEMNDNAVREIINYYRNVWNVGHCPVCNQLYDKEYLNRYGMCIDCYIKDIGMSWRDFY